MAGGKTGRPASPAPSRWPGPILEGPFQSLGQCPRAMRQPLGHCCALTPFLKIQRARAVQGYQTDIQLLSGVSRIRA